MFIYLLTRSKCIIKTLMCLLLISFSLEASSSFFMRGRQDIGKGIGYNQGYTTVETLFFPRSEPHQLLPFLDIRGHHFNNGEYAANAGIGVRKASLYKSFGINAYYDYRGRSTTHFHQVGIGVELLNRRWNFRINTYFPFARRQKTTEPSEVYCCEEFYIMDVSKIYYAFKGLNADIEFLLITLYNTSLYASVGPYFYQHSLKRFFGGQGTAKILIKDFILFSVSVTHDDLFGTRTQGQIGLTFPLGNKKKIRKELSLLSLQSIQRHEVIVLNDEYYCNWNW